MNEQIEIAVAIPTYNRLENLQQCVTRFNSQIVPDAVNLSLVISNSASTDGTAHYLQKLVKSQKNIYVFNELLDWVGGNYGCILKALPPKIEWVWLMGDDDEFASPESVKKVCQLISKNKKNKDFAFIHACDQARSQQSGNVFLDSTFNLCKRFGYLEMLGWFTSLVVRKKEFVSALLEIHQRASVMRGKELIKTPFSAFFHSSYLLQHLHKTSGALFDEPLVREQQKTDHAETEKRWANENMGERYLYVVDDFQRLIELGLPLGALPSQFFKYHKYHLWDRFIIYQINAALELVGSKDPLLISAYQPNFQKNWQRIEFIATMLASTEIQKWLLILSQNVRALSQLLFREPNNKSISEILTQTRNYLTLGCYDYNINHHENTIFRK